MCIRSPNTYTLSLKNLQLTQQKISDYMVLRCWRIEGLRGQPDGGGMNGSRIKFLSQETNLCPTFKPQVKIPEGK
jgi:hypothetical protein